MSLPRLHLSESTSKTLFLVLVASLALVKLLLAALTPLGYDFVLIMSAIVQNANYISWSPFIVLTRGIYSVWLRLPIDHGSPTILLNALRHDPVLLLPSHYLLAALVKTPLLLSDLAAAFLIYTLGANLGGCPAIGRRAALLWLANPFSTLFIEMWGSMDVIVVTLSLASILFMIQRHTRSSAAAIAVGMALKISPILIWLPLATWLFGKKLSRTTALDALFFVSAGPLGIAGYFLWLSQGGLLNLTVPGFTNLMESFDVLNYTPVTQTFTDNFPFPYTYLWSSIMVLIAYYLLAADFWPRDVRATIPLVFSGVLLFYGLTDPFPTAFLWAIPLVALWHSKHGKLTYPLVFYGLLTIFLQTFYNPELTSTGLSFLFIPRTILPMGKPLVAALESLFLKQTFSLQIRSALSGAAFAYAAFVAWTSLRQARD